MAKHLHIPVDPDKTAARATLGITATGVRMRIRTKSGGLGLRRRDIRSTSLWMYNTPMTFNVPVRCDPARTPQGQLLCGVRAHIRTIDTPPRRYATKGPRLNAHHWLTLLENSEGSSLTSSKEPWKHPLSVKSCKRRHTSLRYE